MREAASSSGSSPMEAGVTKSPFKPVIERRVGRHLSPGDVRLDQVRKLCQ